MAASSKIFVLLFPHENNEVQRRPVTGRVGIRNKSPAPGRSFPNRPRSLSSLTREGHEKYHHGRSRKRAKKVLLLHGIGCYSVTGRESAGWQHLLLGKVCNSAIRGSSRSGWTTIWKYKSASIGKANISTIQGSEFRCVRPLV